MCVFSILQWSPLKYTLFVAVQVMQASTYGFHQKSLKFMFKGIMLAESADLSTHNCANPLLAQ